MLQREFEKKCFHLHTVSHIINYVIVVYNILTMVTLLYELATFFRLTIACNVNFKIVDNI